MGRLRKGLQPDGAPLVLRELHRKFMFRARIHLSFVRGTRIREELSPHPNLVFSVERGHHGLRPYEIIEFVPGGTVRQLMERERELVRANEIDILLQVARAVAYMHQKGILHLDLKAENCLVRQDPDRLCVKVTDFDLSRECGNTRNRRRAGTVRYMAPEILQSGTVDIGSDVFSFGVFAYYVVTGHMPFEGTTPEEARRNQVSEKYRVVRPAERVEGLTPKLDQVIMQCLERSTQKRLPSMSYVCKTLEAIINYG